MPLIASYQGPYGTASHRDRLDRIKAVLQQADEKSVDIVCFPECFLTGYFSEEARARETALAADASLFHEMLSELKCYNATAIIGFNEVDDGKLYNSVGVVESGALLGVQRKHYLYQPYFTPGSQYTVFTSKGITFGIIICLDAIYYEPAHLLALQGASVLFCPMCNTVPVSHAYAQRPTYYSHLVARSFENRSWVATADYTWPNDGEMICPGHSCIYDPNGIEIARSAESKEDLVITEIPSTAAEREKGLRVLGSPILNKQLSELRASHHKPQSPEVAHV